MKKAVLITGGAKRVGAALALHFAQAGYDIALHYNSSKQDAEKIRKQVEKLGQKCVPLRYELLVTKGIPAFMEQAKKTLPHTVALINNASIFERASLMETDEALFDRQMAVNFKAPFFLTQAFAKTFKKGVVVNIVDTNVTKTDGSHFAYLLSKKALADFTAMAARELAPKIRVHGVCPGIVLPSNELDAAYMKKLGKELPLRDVAPLAHIAAAAQWLCEYDGTTGQMIYVDGGHHLL